MFHLMRRLEKFRIAWDAFWFAPIDPRRLAIIRIAIGTILFFSYAHVFPYRELLFGPSGVTQSGPADAWGLGLHLSLVIGIGCLASIGLIVGWHSRILAFVLWLIRALLWELNPHIATGGTFVTQFILFSIMFAPLDNAWSVRSAKLKREDQTCFIWPLRLLQINTCFIYFFAGFSKIIVTTQWFPDGDALYYIAQAPGNSWPWPNLLSNGLVLWAAKALTYTTLVIEIGFPFFVWNLKSRPFILFAMATLHLGIIFLVPVASYYSIVMMIILLAFLPENSVKP